jgi:membrane-associated phospholipid phosphatase
MLAIAVLSAGATLALSLYLHRATSTAFDDWMLRQLYDGIGQGGRDALIGLSAPQLTLTLLGAVAVIAALLRQWNVAVLAVVAPVVALGIAEVVLKPLVHRTIGQEILPHDPYPGFGAAFPSGHETGVAAAALVLALVLYRSPLPRSWRVTGWVLLAVWTVVAALGLVRMFFHYTTDAVGAITLTTAVVLGTALLIDTVTEPPRRRAAQHEAQLTWRS